MKKSSTILVAIFTCIAMQVSAGVVMEMSTTNDMGKKSATSRIYADSEMVRVDTVEQGMSPETSMIFRNQEFQLLNHKDKTYTTLDEAAIGAISSRMSAAMKQLEEQLANMPPEQREMMKRMMQGRMPGLTDTQQTKTPAVQLEVIGPGEWRSYKCTQYTVSDDTGVVQRICAASMDQIGGSREALGTMIRMAEFIQKLTASIPGPFAAGMAGNPMEMMSRIDGFPVHMVHYANGRVSHEVSLESAVEQSLEEGIFSPPDDYKEQELMSPSQ